MSRKQLPRNTNTPVPNTCTQAESSTKSVEQTTTIKPCAMMGAGKLVSAVWKTRDQRSEWNVRFNVYRINDLTGHVSQLLRPGDLKDLIKLCQVLAVTLADDANVPSKHLRTLADLAVRLEAVTCTR
ncbi:MAG: hypothetical protein ACYC6N_32810, partial [Pirellulaceae bacterium]